MESKVTIDKNFDGIRPFKSKLWLSSPTMHGDEQKWITEAIQGNWVSTVGTNIDQIERQIALEIIEANSGEFDEQCKNKVIDFMTGQSGNIEKGGTLRLGAYPCELMPKTKIFEYYNQK